MTESEIIALLTKGQRKAPKHYGIGDDASVIPQQIAVSQDTMIEGIHFDEKLTAADVGYKIVAINVSDIAAMGALPDWATLSISLPANFQKQWLLDFASGFREGLQKWGIYLIGGDTTRSPGPIILSMTMGSQRNHKWNWNSQAQVGDDIWVTGTLGDAASGFFHPKKHPYNTSLQRPEPRLDFAFNAREGINSMTDISDGLHRDLLNICSKSQVGAIIDPSSLPKSSVLYQERNALAYQVAFGEDYELLFTATPNMEDFIRKRGAQYRCPVHKIGKIISDSSRVELKDTPWPKPLFEHF